MGEEFGDVRVLLVANQPVLAEALSLQLADEPGLTFVGASADWRTATRAMAADRPDVVVVDLAVLPGGQLIAALASIDPATRVIVVMQDEPPEVARDALVGGATGVVSTSSATTELLDAIHAVTLGVVWLRADLLREVLASSPTVATADGDDLLAALTPREREVLGLMAAGRTRKEIAHELFLSVNTVRTHTQNLLAKLDVHSSLEAVVLAMRAGVAAADESS